MKVLVTGAFGSLGSAFTKFFLDRGDSVVGLDNNEWAVASYPEHPNLKKMLRDFSNVKGDYDLIVHCAAYKHVDLIESNREEARFNNVDKTRFLYAKVTGQVLFVSTDKAVDPCSFYGLTKQEGEQLTLERGGVVLRLGNILSSRGSVIPKWEDALEKGEPLLVTDFRMKRWLISAEEAVAKAMYLLPRAKAGDTIIPSLGDPVSLREMLDRVLTAHGKPLDYPTKEIGLRPGERLEEKLLRDDEEIIYDGKNGIIARRR